MHRTKTSSPYLIKKPFNVSAPEHFIPLVTGKGHFSPLNHPQKTNSIPKFKKVKKITSKNLTPYTRCSMTDISYKRSYRPRSRDLKNRNDIPSFIFDNNENSDLQVFLCKRRPMGQFLGSRLSVGTPNNVKKEVKSKFNMNISDEPIGDNDIKNKGESDGKVFTDEQMIRNMIPPSECIQYKPTKRLDVRNPDLFSNFPIFQNLCVLIAKFLMNVKIASPEYENLSSLEQELFLLYVNKKKQPEHKIKALSKSDLKTLNANWIKKRTNKNLRYVVNKVLKLLRESFKTQLYAKVKPYLHPKYGPLNEKAKFDYCFYGYYFLDAETYLDKEIETYFHPNSRRNAHFKSNGRIPTHISETYLNNLRTSKLFVRDFVIFLKKYLISEAQFNIVSSLTKNCRDWEKWYREEGEEILRGNVLNRFKKNPKGKFPWGVQEVQDGIQNILFKLGQV